MNLIIVKNGKINFKNLVANKINILDFFKELAKRKVLNIENIKILIFYKNKYIFKMLKEPISLIVDSKYVFSNLFNSDKNFFWLRKILMKYKLNIKYIKYAVISKNKLFIIKYNN